MLYIKDQKVYAFPISGYTNTIREEDWEELNANPKTKVLWNGDVPYSVPKSTFEMKDTLLAEYQNYLNDTDWYVTRFAETGVEIPEDVKDKRASARAEIDRLRDLNNPEL